VIRRRFVLFKRAFAFDHARVCQKDGCMPWTQRPPIFTESNRDPVTLVAQGDNVDFDVHRSCIGMRGRVGQIHIGRYQTV
jgi:hypothetical protein